MNLDWYQLYLDWMGNQVLKSYLFSGFFLGLLYYMLHQAQSIPVASKGQIYDRVLTELEVMTVGVPKYSRDF